jgi:hypothetical protein
VCGRTLSATPSRGPVVLSGREGREVDASARVREWKDNESQLTHLTHSIPGGGARWLLWGHGRAAPERRAERPLSVELPLWG